MGHSESGPTTEMLHEGMHFQHGDESVLLFRAGNVPCCVDLSQLEELTRLPATTRVPLAPPWVTGLFNHRSNVVPAIDLRRCLGLPSAELGTGFLLLSGIDGERVAFWVDEVLDIVTPAEESWQELPPTAALPYCDHVLVTKDAIHLFLNLAKLLDLLQERRRTGASDSSSVSQLLETVRSGRLGESWAASRSSVRIQKVSSASGGGSAAETDAGSERPSTASPGGVFVAVAAKAAELRVEEAERAAASLKDEIQPASESSDAPETIAANLTEGRELEIVPAAPAETPVASRADAHQDVPQEQQPPSTASPSGVFAAVAAKAAELRAEEAECAAASLVGDAQLAPEPPDAPASAPGAQVVSSERTATSAGTSAETSGNGQESTVEAEDSKVEASERKAVGKTKELPVEFGETVTLTVAEESGPETKTPGAASADFAGRVESSSLASGEENAIEGPAAEGTAEELSVEVASPASASDDNGDPEYQLSASESGGEDSQAAAADIAATADVSADEPSKGVAPGGTDGVTGSKNLVWAKKDSERKLMSAQPWAVFPMSRKKSGAVAKGTGMNSAATPQSGSPGEKASASQTADNVWMAPALKKKAKATDSSSQEDAARVSSADKIPARKDSANGAIPALDLADDSYEAHSPREPEKNTEKESDDSTRWLLVAAIPLGIIVLAIAFLFATRGSGPARPGAQVQPPPPPEVEPATAGPVDVPESGSAEDESFSAPVVGPSAAGSVAAPVDSPLESPAEPPRVIGVIVVDGVRHDILYGDTLSKISGRYLGDIMRYPELADYNDIPNPDLIFAGGIIRIPPRRKEEDSPETGPDDDQ